MSDNLTIDKMTIPQLKELADRIGVTYASKVKKDELKQAVTEKLTDIMVEQAKQKAAAMATKPVKVIAPMPNSERVQKYTRQNNGGKLTVAQMRQVRKAARKQSDNLVYVSTRENVTTLGASLVGRTPNGLFIGHVYQTA